MFDVLAYFLPWNTTEANHIRDEGADGAFPLGRHTSHGL